VEKLVVSCDSPEPGEYQSVRGTPIGPLEDGLSALSAAKEKAKSSVPLLAFEFVAMKHNLMRLKDMPRFARKWGAVSLLVTNLIPYTPEMTEHMTYSIGCVSTGPDPSSWRGAWEAAARDWFTWGTLDLPRTRWGAARRCRFIEDKSATISWTGEVSPCLPLSHTYDVYGFGRAKRIHRLSFGSLARRSLAAIWCSPRYVRFRSRVRLFRFPSCVDCLLGDTCDYRAQNADCWGAECSCADCLWAQDMVRCP